MNRHSIILALVGAGALACVSPSEIEEIKSNQKKILAKLEEVGKGAPRAPQRQPNRPDPAKVYSFDVGSSAVKGGDDAWVTIVEVSDFQCPFCKRVGPTLKQVAEKYGKDVRVTFKHNPLSFHKRALPAAMAAECAKDQGKFWEMHDKLFENQRALEDADLEKYAKELGLKTGDWKKCYSGNKHKASIMKDQQQSVALGARGTPAFFINGRFLSGAQPFPRFDALIKEELEKAKKSGISQKDYYAKAVVAKGAKKL